MAKFKEGSTELEMLMHLSSNEILNKSKNNTY